MKKFIFCWLIILSCKQPSNNNVPNYNKIKSEAEIAYNQNNFLKSISLFSQLIEIDSTNGEYYFKRGYSYSFLLNAQDAIKDYLTAATLNYRKSDAYLNVGINYSTLNDKAAIYYFKKCLEIDSNNIKAKIEMKDCYERLKKANHF